MNEHLHKRLQSLINMPVKYGMKVITITGYICNDDKGRVYIHTDERDNHFDRTYDAVPTLLKEFTPATVIAKSDQMEVVVNNTNNMVDTLKDLLMDNITKVKNDPGYIAQAKEINKNVNSILNLTRLQMEAVNMQNKF